MKRGFIAGAWDLLHPGHLIALRECAKNCDFLVVGLHVDPSLERNSKSKPVQSLLERLIQLSACKSVDHIIPYETEKDLLTILQLDDIDVRFLDEKYRELELPITGKDIVPIVYLPRKHSWSSSELRERIKKSR